MSTSLSPLLASMLSSAAMRAVCDDVASLQHMLDFEAALARAEAANGVIPTSAADTIAKACKASSFDLGALAEAATGSGNLAIPLVKALTAGANAPERFGKIILSNTACHYPDPTNWLNRIKAVKEGGIEAVADTVIAGWLTADFREREPQVTANMKAMLLATPVEGYLACCEALSTLDQRELLPKIKSPTLVIAGRHDMATPVAAGEFIRGQICGASLTILDAAHISNVELPRAFTEAVVGFLTQR